MRIAVPRLLLRVFAAHPSEFEQIIGDAAFTG
jgi:hypothetical protein